jgi:hypothetical protein
MIYITLLGIHLFSIYSQAWSFSIYCALETGLGPGITVVKQTEALSLYDLHYNEFGWDFLSANYVPMAVLGTVAPRELYYDTFSLGNFLISFT